MLAAPGATSDFNEVLLVCTDPPETCWPLKRTCRKEKCRASRVQKKNCCELWAILNRSIQDPRADDAGWNFKNYFSKMGRVPVRTAFESASGKVITTRRQSLRAARKTRWRRDSMVWLAKKFCDRIVKRNLTGLLIGSLRKASNHKGVQTSLHWNGGQLFSQREDRPFRKCWSHAGAKGLHKSSLYCTDQ